MNDVFSRKWQWEIGRNLPVWHKTLNLNFKYVKKTYKDFGLPCFFQLSLFDKNHCDFYHAVDNRSYNRNQFASALLKQYGKKEFVKSLRPKYKKILSNLLHLSKHLSPNYSSLKNFLDCYGFASPLLDITAIGSKVVSTHLFELLKDNPGKYKIIEFYGEPRGLAPMQKLEKEIAELKKKKFDLNKEAKRLCRKYGWIPANFVGPVWTVEDMKQKINNFSFEPKRKNVRPPCVSDEIKYWARCVGEIAYLNEFRKAYFTQAAVFARPVLDIIAKNNGLGSWHEINLLTDSEILDLLRGKNREQKKIIEHRKNNKIAFYNTNKGEIAFLNKKDLQKFIKLFGTYGGNDGLVSGMIANKGIVRGHAKIILTPNDFQKFKQGDILIADMTSTDFIPIMKKAAAFVTDEGGLACHAAIVSREYGKPCVIGTKIATKVFRDGDFVEVDADKGNVIKIL